MEGGVRSMIYGERAGGSAQGISRREILEIGKERLEITYVPGCSLNFDGHQGLKGAGQRICERLAGDQEIADV